jgi:hypothetical protein
VYVEILWYTVKRCDVVIYIYICCVIDQVPSLVMARYGILHSMNFLYSPWLCCSCCNVVQCCCNHEACNLVAATVVCMEMTNTHKVGLEILTVVSTQMAVFWVVAPYSLVEVFQHFRGPCCPHHQGNITTQKTAIYILSKFSRKAWREKITWKTHA